MENEKKSYVTCERDVNTSSHNVNIAVLCTVLFICLFILCVSFLLFLICMYCKLLSLLI